MRIECDELSHAALRRKNGVSLLFRNSDLYYCDSVAIAVAMVIGQYLVWSQWAAAVRLGTVQ